MPGIASSHDWATLSSKRDRNRDRLGIFGRQENHKLRGPASGKPTLSSANDRPMHGPLHHVPSEQAVRAAARLQLTPGSIQAQASTIFELVKGTDWNLRHNPATSC